MAKVFLRAYNREIETMIDRGQLDEAIAHCHHVLKTFPKHLETYRLLGKAYLESKRYGDAVDIFSRVLASVPNDFVAQVGMSIIRDEENKLDDAIWHMERAFETQPSNSAIQGELQRLYGRRDGIQPPRIRMTRGALAHMYVHGELYPQAISEIKSVLNEDPGRSDMQALLARAYFKSGSKNDAVDAALALLQRYPYSLDANRVLVDVLSADRNENVQSYRQRVVELDPYAAQVTGSVFLSNEVADAAVNLERLDWNGQPVGMQADWRESNAISLDGGRPRDEQPDWLKTSFAETTPPPLSQPSTGSIFDTPASSSSAPAQSSDEIPDFLKAAGWGESTGAFDETQSLFGDDAPAGSAQPLAQGDLPDWVKAMKPAETVAPPAQEPQAQDEEGLPDWISNIGKGALGTAAATETDWMSQPEQSQTSAASSSDQPDWMTALGQPAQESNTDQPDWMKSAGNEPDFTPQPAQTDTPDWLKGLGNEPEPTSTTDESDWLKGIGETESMPQSTQSDAPDWLKGLGDEPEPTSTTNEPDWLKGVGEEPQPAAVPSEDDWLKQFGTAAPSASTSSDSDFDFLNELTQEPVAQTPEFTQPASSVEQLGSKEQDDAFAWLEGLAAKQGASEGLLTKPEERLDEEPEWVKQAKGLMNETPVSQPPANVEELGMGAQEQDDAFSWLESLAAKQGASEGLLTKPEERLEQEPEWVKQAKGLTNEPPVSQPLADVEELGKGAQEQDDAFAWLEGLAAKQGASEGLLTKPEDRLEQEPEWVKQAKSAPIEPIASQPEPAANVEELGKGAQEQDDAFAWLEGLAAKQGASEGLLTKPEDRLEQEPEWVKQSKSAPIEPVVSQPPANVEELGKSVQEQDDSFSWLESLAAKQGASEGLLTKPEERLEQEPEWVKQAKSAPVEPVATHREPVMEQPSPVDDTTAWLQSLDADEEKQPDMAVPVDATSMWLKSLEQEEVAPVQPAVQSADVDMPAWMKNIEQEEAPVAGPTVPAQEAELTPADVVSPESELPSWLNEFAQEEKVPMSSNMDDLPAWLQDETGEVIAEPEKIEPTKPTDWKPVEEKPAEVHYNPPVEPEQPKIIYSPPLEETPRPEPVAFEPPPQEPVAPPQETAQPEPRPIKKASDKPAPATPQYVEPVTRTRGTGMLVMPGIDSMLGLARTELSRSNIPGALESYGKLIKKGRFLEEVIFDLREALYRYPVEVSIWQSLGDAYMRANRLQDALDAYTKAEELLR